VGPQIEGFADMRIAALFAGIGGLEAGFSASGHTCVLTCEVSEPAIGVLKRQFPDVPNHPDVGTLGALPADVDVLTAGFPCQDLSQAGMTAGIRGARSGLVAHVFRLLDAARVPVVVLENVSFMLQLERGAAMERLTRAFEERGYRWAYRTINSLAFLPQRRRRVFLVASRGDVAPEAVLFGDDVAPPASHTTLATHAHGFYWTEGTRGLGWAADAIPTLKNGSTVGVPSPPAILMPDGRLIKPDIRDAERLQGFAEDWTIDAEPRRRWALVGNAVTVPVAAWLGRQLQAPGQYAGTSDRDWPRKAAMGAWPGAARFDGRRRFVVAAGEAPVWRERAPLHAFLRYPGTHLSERATAGFLGRARASSLRFVPGFLDAVARHLQRVRAGEFGGSDVPQRSLAGLAPIPG
jgi:DNA (cytosine-5)-methyltransferase 1